MKDIGWQPSPVTVGRMDAASERTWTYCQRVTGGGCQFMSWMGLMRFNPDAVGIKANDGNFNGTAVIVFGCILFVEWLKHISLFAG